MIRAGKPDPVMTAGPEKPENERFNNSPESPRALCAPRTQFGRVQQTSRAGGALFIPRDLVGFIFFLKDGARTFGERAPFPYVDVKLLSAETFQRFHPLRA